jgi:hypothetical protein
MNRIAIDRLDLSFAGLDGATAEAVRSALPAALAQALRRRLADAGPAGAVLDLAGADLGTLDLPARCDARAAAQAIAARLADWVATRAPAPRPER